MPLISTFANGSARGYGMFGGIASLNSYESIATVTVGSGGATTIDFAGIPTGYKHLQLRISSRLNYANWWASTSMRFNGDSGNNYSYHDLLGDGSSAQAQNASSQNKMYIGWSAGTTTNANVFGSIIVDILDYTNVSKNKTVKSLSGVDGNGGGIVSIESNAWYSTNAINSISIIPNNGTTFQQYSQFALYGIKG
jgi:hypothetical protein